MELMDTYNPIVEQLRSTNGKLRQRVAELEKERDVLKQQRDELNRLCEFNEKTMGKLLKQRDELLSELEELADLMDDVRSGDYKPDSFTTQPARAAIASVKEKQNGN